MQNIRPFEIALIGIFAVAGIIGLFYISNYDSSGDDPLPFGAGISMWGTLDQNIVDDFLVEMSSVDKALEVVTYTQIDARRFDSELVNAIAEGRSPDLVIMPHELLVSYRTKLQPISFETMSERAFRDTYIDGADIFKLSDGIYGIPFAVDPLVMYWNRDIFSSSGLASPPKTWESLVSQTTKAVVRLDDERNITQSAVAFGEYVNVTHAKNILSMLFLQAGSTLVEEKEKTYSVTLNEGGDSALSPGDAVLTFYTQFSLQTKDLYSWNRAKNTDRTEFLNGTLGMYFGKGSETKALERENANLNFDIAPIPQGSGSTIQRDYGDFYAFAIPRASQNIQGAYAVASLFGNVVNAQKLADAFNFAPVHRTLFEGPEADPTKAVIYQSALISHGWLDPSPKESEDIFRKAVEEVSSGRARLKSVIMDTVQELESLF